MKILIPVVITLVTAAAFGAALVYSGAISFAADEPHSAAVFELIEAARERSVEARSDEVEARPLDDAALIARGAGHYGTMCEGCHLAPGMNDTDLRRGLYPQPPDLASRDYAQQHRDDPQAVVARQFWIVKHGLKASGMPAWGVTHDDEAIWGIVAFLQRLPDLSPAQYEELTAGGHHHDEGDQDDGNTVKP